VKNGKDKKQGGKARQNSRTHMKLTFEFTFNNSMDTVHFAPCYPYTYSKLSHLIRE